MNMSFNWLGQLEPGHTEMPHLRTRWPSICGRNSDPEGPGRSGRCASRLQPLCGPVSLDLYGTTVRS
jgi:hypothetical protein